jgi:hypothetical protein
MARMPNARVLVEVLRSGNLGARLRAAREGLTGAQRATAPAAASPGSRTAPAVLDQGLTYGHARQARWPAIDTS